MSRAYRIAAVAAISAIALAGCAKRVEDVGTAVRVHLDYDDHLGLAKVDVSLAGVTQTGDIEHELLLLVPETLDGQTLPLVVVGLDSADQPIAFGDVPVTVTKGKTAPAKLTIGACTPGCGDDNAVVTCTGPRLACPSTCTGDGVAAHCFSVPPSNGVDLKITAGVPDFVLAKGTAVLNTDTGEITGAIKRGADKQNQLDAGIYFTKTAPRPDGPPIGVFAFGNLTVEAGATLRFTGDAAVALAVGGNATLDGRLDVSAGFDAAGGAQANQGGPGGGRGATGVTGDVLATGCGVSPPAPGVSGGGGGGGAVEGGPAGDADTTRGVFGGAGCLVLTATGAIDPLQGGSGGGAGGTRTATGARGGGGGGAIQISALGEISIGATGAAAVIVASGAGGEGGPISASDGSGGAGAGAGGTILLEATTVVVGNQAILAANGGGGGGGSTALVVGGAGDNGGTTFGLPQAGLGGGNNNSGGTGGSSSSGPDAGGSQAGGGGGGGGGGGYGVIAIRAHDITPGPNRSTPVLISTATDLQ